MTTIIRNSLDPADTGYRRPLQRFRAPRGAAGRALLFFAISLMAIALLPVLISYSPTQIDASATLTAPGREHLLGTDQVGRDIASRVAHGAQLSLLIAATAAGIALVAGAVLGALATTGPRWLNELIMRAMDVGLAFPGILLAIVLAAVMGPGMTTTVVVLGIIYTPSMTRVVRASIYQEYGQDYVTAARLMGSSRIRVVGYHIGINSALPVLVYTTVIAADAIVAEAALSFIGAGVKPPTPSLGNIIRDGYSIVHAGAWWVSLFPGLMILLLVLGLNRFSEAIGRRLRRHD